MLRVTYMATWRASTSGRRRLHELHEIRHAGDQVLEEVEAGIAELIVGGDGDLERSAVGAAGVGGAVTVVGEELHRDTVQTVGHFPVDVSKTRINFLSGASHKFHGPKGVGFIYINSDNIIRDRTHRGNDTHNPPILQSSTSRVVGNTPVSTPWCLK